MAFPASSLAYDSPSGGFAEVARCTLLSKSTHSLVTDDGRAKRGETEDSSQPGLRKDSSPGHPTWRTSAFVRALIGNLISYQDTRESSQFKGCRRAMAALARLHPLLFLAMVGEVEAYLRPRHSSMAAKYASIPQLVCNFPMPMPVGDD